MVNNLENACNEIYIDEDFYVFLTIEGTSVENVRVKVSNPWDPLKILIKRIIAVFKLPKLDGGGCPVQYLLGQIMDDGEPEILQFEDEEGREQALIDYNIQPGDHLHLISVPICGTRFADLYYVQTKRFLRFTYQVLCKYEHFSTYGYTKSRIEQACKDLNLADSNEYYLCKIVRRGFDDIDLKYLSITNSEYDKTYLDDYIEPEDYCFFTEKPVLILLRQGVKISKRIYKRLKKEYNDKRRNV